MNITEIAIIVIAGILVLKGLISIILMLMLWRSYRKDITPLIRKSDGIMRNVVGMTESLREDVEELGTVVDDITYRTRAVTSEVQNRIIPTFAELAGAISGIARVISYFFSRKK